MEWLGVAAQAGVENRSQQYDTFILLRQHTRSKK